MTLSRHIDEEGIRIEPALLYEKGARNEELMARILSAVRTPDERLGDLDAQLAANRVGARALQRLVAGEGIEKVRAYGGALLDYSQAFMARAISAIPDGRYRFEDVMDEDGAGQGPVPIRVCVSVEGDRVGVDFAGTSRQVAGCINCPEAVTRSAVYYCFACLLDEQVPFNAGCFRNIRVVSEPGTLVHAEFPAAVVAGNTETSQRVVDVVFGALAKALPEKIPAASCGTMSSVAMGGAGWTYYETIAGGSGASAVGDGASAVQCHMTNTLNTPAEALEMQYPLRVRRFERAQGTGGGGRWRGGDGVMREIEALGDCEGTVLSDRRVRGPYGLEGGAPGAIGVNSIVGADGKERGVGGKAKFELKVGERLRVRTPGGGGYDHSCLCK
jgi:N-methylhydantoinase B